MKELKHHVENPYRKISFMPNYSFFLAYDIIKKNLFQMKSLQKNKFVTRHFQ